MDNEQQEKAKQRNVEFMQFLDSKINKSQSKTTSIEFFDSSIEDEESNFEAVEFELKNKIRWEKPNYNIKW